MNIRLPYSALPTLARGLAGALGLAAVGAAGVLVGAAAYATEQINRRTPPTFLDHYTFSPFETRVEGFEEVAFRTADGISLSGWWLPYPGSQRVIVGLGGHRSPAADLLGIGSGLWRAGNNLLLFDWRSRGRSEVAQHSLAYYELRDAEAAVAYARSRLPNPALGLIGYSMGAAIAILLAARDQQVQAVVADSSFTSIAEVIGHAATRLKLPSSPVVGLANHLNAWRYGYHFGQVRPIDAVAHISPRPLLLVHSAGDSLIPLEQAYQLYHAASEPKQLWVVEQAEHCGAYFADRPAYVERVADFFQHYL